MKIRFLLLTLLFSSLLTNCKHGQKTNKTPEKEQKSVEITPETTDFGALLSDSPRHHEWKTLTSNGRELYTFIAYPEVSEYAKAVIVIHENRGLNDWARYFVDQLAAEGYVVLAPDLLSNFKENIKKTTDFEDSDKAREAIYAINDDKVTADLDAVFKYAKSINAASGEVAVVGFCWGGTQTFRYATHNPDITSANVFYGTAPENSESLKHINAPVFGYYGGDDNRVNSTIEETRTRMIANGKTYESMIYDGAGHAFMRRGEEAGSNAANEVAYNKAWERLLAKLKSSF